MATSAGRILMMFKGDYSSTITYERLDCVKYQSSTYVAKRTTKGNAPTDTTYWQLLAAGSDFIFTNIGDATKGIYFDESGNAKPMTYKVESDVPSNAVFTDALAKMDGYIQTGKKFGTTVAEYATAEGCQTTASGEASHAEGFETLASNYYSHAEGQETEAKGQVSHAEGYQTSANGTASHSEGYNTIASGRNSHASGFNTMADYANQFVCGTYNDPSANENALFTVGNGTSEEKRSNAFEVLSDGSVREGKNTIASGRCSHAEGLDTTANNTYAHAEGEGTIANAPCTHAEGGYTSATGSWSHAEGYRTNASKSMSHAEGGYTSASGRYSHASGYYTTAGNDYQFVCGMYNDNQSDSLFEVGNGTSSNRSNAFRVNSSGTPSAVNGLVTISDRNLKRDILPIDEDLERVFLETPTYTFYRKDGNRRHIGTVAQDVEDVIKAHNISSEEFAPLCKDPKQTYNAEEKTFEPLVDENGEPVYEYSFRYEEYMMLTVHMVQKLYKRIDELEKELLKTKGDN